MRMTQMVRPVTIYWACANKNPSGTPDLDQSPLRGQVLDRFATRVAKIHEVASIFATITILFLRFLLLKTSHIYMELAAS